MAELVDALDLKSSGQQWPCRFDSGFGYKNRVSVKSESDEHSLCFFFTLTLKLTLVFNNLFRFFYTVVITI